MVVLVALVAMSFHRSLNFVIYGFVGATIGVILADVGRSLWLVS
jgi:hypothetical protein